MRFKWVLFLAICFYATSCFSTMFPLTGGERRVYADTKKGFNLEWIDRRVIDRHMGRLDTFVKWLEVAIPAENWDKITLYAKNVDSLFELLIARNIDTKNFPQAFFEIDLKLQESRDFLVEASERRDMKALQDEFKRMRNTCKQCHGKYRKKPKGR